MYKAVVFPKCSLEETQILQMRARGMSFRQIERATGIGPRKASDLYFAAMRKIVEYLETQSFLEPTRQP